MFLHIQYVFETMNNISDLEHTALVVLGAYDPVKRVIYDHFGTPRLGSFLADTLISIQDVGLREHISNKP